MAQVTSKTRLTCLISATRGKKYRNSENVLDTLQGEVSALRLNNNFLWVELKKSFFTGQQRVLP
jgi:hypothetical protein